MNDTTAPEQHQTEQTGPDQATPATAAPSRAVAALGRLVGTWDVAGGAEGVVRYEWLPGNHFLLQHVDLAQFGQPVTGLEVIGHLHPFGEPIGEDVVSRFFDAAGNTFDYVYEMDGDTLTIWAGAKGSPAYFRGTFAEGGRTLAGEWVYPGGGGYASTMTRRQATAHTSTMPARQAMATS